MGFVIAFFGFFVVAFLMCQAPGHFGAIVAISVLVVMGALFGFGGVVVVIVLVLAVLSYIEHRLVVRERQGRRP